MLQPVRLKLLGRFGLWQGDEEMPRLPRKTQALLAFLALEQDRHITREAMAELLWPDRGTQQARHSLRQTLLTLSKAAPRKGPAVVSHDGRLALAPDVMVDAQQLRRVRQDATRDELQAAADSYVGALLQHFPAVSPDFDHWLEGMRLAVDDDALDVLGRLSDAALAAGDIDEAIASAERMLAIDPLREDVHRRLMRACASAGRRAEALRHYNAATELLGRELAVSPSPETETLAKQIRAELNTTPAAARARSSESPHIAVLPFHQLGATALPSHWADGLVADMTSQLAGLRELSVISHGSTLTLRDINADPCEVGRKLGARYLVRGAIRRAGAEVRVNAELVQTETGTLVWARAMDIPRALSFEGQDRVVAQVVNTLAPRVHDAELQRIKGRRPNSLTAYEKVLLARELINELDPRGFTEARQLLDDAIVEEPDYAEAYALAADWYGLLVAEGRSANRTADIVKTERLARKALSLDRENVRALVFYAHRRSLLHRDYLAAQALFGRALDIQPSSADAWRWSSFTYAYIGDAGEAIQRADRALQLSPCDHDAHSFYLALCVAHYTAGNYDVAVDWGMRALAAQPVLRGTAGWVAAALAALGRVGEARSIVADTMAKWPDRRVSDVIARHPYRDLARREGYGKHLLAAGFPE